MSEATITPEPACSVRGSGGAETHSAAEAEVTDACTNDHFLIGALLFSLLTRGQDYFADAAAPAARIAGQR